MRSALPLLAAAALLACSHDAPRENPLDPELTPAVELTAALDDSAGTVSLSWTPYDGQQPFAAYLVERRVQGQEAWTTLDTLELASQLAFADSALTPGAAYDYRIVVESAAGYGAPSNRAAVAGYSIAAVSLSEPETDAEAGSVSLRWTGYRGPGFAGYTLSRRQVGTDQDTTLLVASSPDDTLAVDTTALHGVAYTYGLTLSAAGQDLRSSAVVGVLELPAPAMTPPAFASETASASLAWHPYSGPRFASYRVERHTEATGWQLVAETADSADTARVDAGLVGNTLYTYRVAAVTARGEAIRSEPAGGAFHQLTDTWEMPAGDRRFVRLYGGEHDPLLGVVAENARSCQVVRVGPDGSWNPEGETLLLDGGAALALAVAALPDGARLFAGASKHARGLWGTPQDRSFFALRQGEDGRFVRTSFTVPTDALPQTFPGAEARLAAEISLVAGGQYPDVAARGPAGQLLVSGFDDLPFGDLQGEIGDWELEGSWHHTPNGYFYGRDQQSLARYHLPAEGDIQLEASAMLTSTQGWQLSRPAIRIGGDEYSRFTVALDLLEQEVELAWRFAPPDSLDLEAREVRSTYPFEVVEGLVYELALGVSEGAIDAAILSPATAIAAVEAPAAWASAALLHDTPAIAFYDRPALLSGDGEVSLLSPLEAGVSELRVWQPARGQGLGIGVCLPEANKLLLGTVAEGFEQEWPSSLTRGVGPAVQEADFLFYPLSFDVGPDGRIYVLDAGNARIVVYDSSRRFVTQWGSFGSGSGQFDFGRGGRRPTGEMDFAGSIAVGGDGYIYVADEINRRIQRFAP